MPPDDNEQRVLVTDRVTGAEAFIRPGDFDAATQELAADQVATVDPLSAGGEFAVGQAVTERALAGGLLPGVTPESRAALTAEQVESDVFDSTSNTVKQAALGVASGATLGLLPAALRSDDPFERERQRRERGAAPTAFTVGEVVGSVVPSLFSGGTGALATASRFTPAGQLGRLTGRIAARGTGLVQRVGTGAAAGAIQGAGEAMGQNLASQALSENPWSAESMAAAGGLGGLLGGVLGGAVPAIGAGAQAFRKTRGARPRGAAALASDDLAGVGLTRDKGGRLRDVRGKFVTKEQAAALFKEQGEGAVRGFRGEGVSFDELVGPAGQARVADDFAGLLSHVDDQTRLAAAATLDDLPSLVSRMDDLGIDAALSAQIRGELSEASADFLAASNRASAWTTEATRALGVDDISKLTPAQVRKALPDALEDRGADVLAELDTASTRYRASVATVEDSLGETLQSASVGAALDPSAIQPGGLGERVRGVTDRFRDAISSRRGVVDAAGTVLGAAELARDVGGLDVPTARDLPGIGAAVSLWARYKAGVNAARRIGVLPASAATRGAAQVNAAEGIVSRAVSRAARGVVSVGGSRLVRKLGERSSRAVAQQVVELRGQDPAAIAQAAQEAATQADSRLGATAAETAQRAHDYLVAEAPKNPLAGTLNEDKWTPTEVERRNWAVTLAAVADPVDAIEASFGDPYPDRALRAIENVYPAMYRDMQARLMGDAASIRKNMSGGRQLAIGRAYKIPLAITQQASFLPSLVSPADQAQAAQGRPAAPRSSTTSPLGTLELTGAQRRAIG